MGGDHQANRGSARHQGNGWAIVKRTGHPTFWMDAHLIRWTRKSLLDLLQTKEAVVATAGHHPKVSSHNIDERSGVSIESIQTKQHESCGKGKLARIAADHLDGPQQVSSVIPIARF